MRRKQLYIEVSGIMGQDIDETKDDMSALATELGLNVEADLNGTVWTAHPDGQVTKGYSPPRLTIPDEPEEESKPSSELIETLKEEIRWLRSQIEGPRLVRDDTLPFEKLKEIGESFLRENGIEPPDPFFKTSPDTD